MKKIGINGFGRIGRVAARIILTKYQGQLELAMINASSSMDVKGWAHLLEFDTMYRRFPGTIAVKGDTIVVNGKPIKVVMHREPTEIPWSEAGVETVIESTGVFLDEASLKKHLKDTVTKVVLSAPAKGGDVKTVVLGINSMESLGSNIISNASCTTNCVSPVTQVVLQAFGIEKAAMTTIHAYTSDQELQDGSHKDLRRARSAANNIVPTTTGAAIATALVIPEVENKFDGFSIRVPVATGSMTDFTFITKKNVTEEEVNKALTEAAHSEKLHNYLWVTEKPLVSSDIIGCEASALVDLTMTKVIDGNLVKIFAWYDNEWGYSNRLVEQTLE